MKYRIHRGVRQRIKASEVNRWNKMVQQHQVGALAAKPPTVKDYDPSSRVILVKNTSGTDRQIGEIAKLGALLWDLEVDGTADVVWEIATIAADSTPVVLIEPIANGDIGSAIVDGLAMALCSGGTGGFAEPDIANNRLKPAATGTIKLLQAPHATDLRLLPVILGVGGAATPNYEILRLGFSGRDSSNAVKWDNAFIPAAGYLNYSAWPGSGNMTSSIGVTAVADTSGGAPASAEMLRFAEAGDYRLTIAWKVGVENVNFRPMATETKLLDIGAKGIGGELGQRVVANGAAGYVGAGGIQWFVDVRAVRIPGIANLKVGVSVVTGTGTLPDPHGSLTVERCH